MADTLFPTKADHLSSMNEFTYEERIIGIYVVVPYQDLIIFDGQVGYEEVYLIPG